jgi:hypothetical protein
MRSTVAALLLLLAPATAAAATVRTDRPRLLLSNGTGFGTSLATLKQRCTSDPNYQSRCQGALGNTQGGWPAVNQAAAYLVTGDAAQCNGAYMTAQMLASGAPGQPDPHSFISNNGRTMEELAIVRDWCDPALSAAQKQWLESTMTLWGDWYVANSAPDVFHDDMANVWNAVALAGLALKGTAQDAKATSYLTAADTQWKTVILPAMAYVGDWWHEGMTYVQVTLGALTWYAHAWSTATDENIFTYVKQNAGDLFNGYLAFFSYAMRPDYKYFYFGDTSDNKQTIELFSRWLVDMWTAGTGSALGQGLSDEIKQHSRPGYDYSGADAVLLPLFYDASRAPTATQRSTLPLGRWMSKGANDVAVLRSGWGADDTVVMVTCGDYLGPHQHDETGSFQIFRRAGLTGSTGYYDNFDSTHWDNYYAQHSVHADTLAVYQPGEIFPDTLYLGDPTKNVNDGGQRPLRRNKSGTGFPSTNLATYKQNLKSGPFYETGDMTSFEVTSCHQYVACNVTAAYSSPGSTTDGNMPKVSEVSRQLVFVPPQHIVVFDRVESLQASFEKRFLLHAVGSAPQVTGQSFTLQNGAGTLVGTTLLPTAAKVNTISNFSVEGNSYPPNPTGVEAGGTRLEVIPATPKPRDYFLHVIDAIDSVSPPAPTLPATVQEAANVATVTFGDASNGFVVSFDETGALGGHIKVTRGGTTACDEDLGASSQTTSLPDGGVAPAGDGGSGGGVEGGVGGRSGGDAGSGSGASASTGSGGGCGCRLGSAREDAVGASALLLGLAALLRRRRARPPT